VGSAGGWSTRPYYRGRGYEETGRRPFPAGESTKLPCEFVVMSKSL
jgi:hypothetical protein